MSNVLRLAIVDPDEGSRESLKSMLLSMDLVWLEAECSRYDFFPDVVSQTTPDVGIINIDSDSERGLALLERLTQESPETILLVASSSTEGTVILRAMRAGAREFLTLPLTAEDLDTALRKIGQQKYGGAEGKSRSCEVIAVAGATGGAGSTSLAVNLGCILAAESRASVALVDLDLALGDADVFLDTIPDYTLADVTQNISRLDIQLLKKSLTKHPSGLYLLPRPVDLHDTHVITPESLQKVLGLLKASFSHLILDLSKAYTPVDMAALEIADQVVLITQLDLPCLRNVVRLMMSFEEIDGLKDKVRIVVNRAGLDAGQISLKKAKETIGRDIFTQIPNDYKTMVEVRNNGVPLITQAPRAVVTEALRELVVKLTGEAKPVQAESGDVAAAAPPTKWLKFWPGSAKPKH
jgi:pilus assembly protein CpaE